MVSRNLSRQVETSSGAIYISWILFHKILAKESRVSPQLLGYRRRNPPTVTFSARGFYSAVPRAWG